MNQDVLENFFSQIKSHGCANRNPSPAQFEAAFKSLIVCNYTSKHCIGANCHENNEGTTYALSQLMNVGEKMKQQNSELMDETECVEAMIPAATENKILLNEKKILKCVRDNETIALCEQCANNVDKPEISTFIRDSCQILEKAFMNICHEEKLGEKLTHILEEKYLMSCLPQCTHIQNILSQTINEEFIKISCSFINNILCRKIDIESDNHIYNAAKRISMRYRKKNSENKTEK